MSGLNPSQYDNDSLFFKRSRSPQDPTPESTFCAPRSEEGELKMYCPKIWLSDQQ